MKLVGLSGTCLPNDSLLVEWKCPDGVSGVISRAAFNDHTAYNFFVIRFDWKKKDGSLEALVDGEEVVIGGVTSSPPMWSGGVDAPSFSKLVGGGIDWHVEPGDVISLRVLNVTYAVQNFQMGFAVEDGFVASDGRWWADEHGKLIRALTFVEHGLRTGSRVGSLIVVDPETYEGFDSE